MVGSGIIFTPWAYAEAGIINGLLLTFAAYVISFGTQYFVMVSAGNDMDYTETLQKTFGSKGWYAGIFIFTIQLFIPIVMYFQLLA
jgi:amino acid permease